MAKEKFDIIQSTCIPIEIDNNNTDNIIPARYLAFTTRDPKFYGEAFMHDLRYDADNKPVADFVMNKPEFSEPPRKGVHEIIVGGQNWGSGSSREHAAWAIAVFQGAGILYSPGKASNAGGVATSGLEMTQNSMRLRWSAEEVDQHLHSIMKDIHNACVQYGTKADGTVNYVDGANLAGFIKVADAMCAQGLV